MKYPSSNVMFIRIIEILHTCRWDKFELVPILLSLKLILK